MSMCMCPLSVSEPMGRFSHNTFSVLDLILHSVLIGKITSWFLITDCLCGQRDINIFSKNYYLLFHCVSLNALTFQKKYDLDTHLYVI